MHLQSDFHDPSFSEQHNIPDKETNMKKRVPLILTVIIILVIIIGVLVSRNDTPQLTVGICQFSQHDSLNAATKGFQDAVTQKLGDQVTFLEQNAQGDYSACTAIINAFVSENVDLILANSTFALQTAATATDEIPILGTAVTGYDTALQLDDTADRGKNISGTSDLAPLSEQAAMIQELFPDAQNIGVLYCSAEPNSQYQADGIKAELEALGYSCSFYAFSDSNDISPVTLTAVEKSDVIYIPTDNTAAANAELIGNICLPAQCPVITAEENTCRICGAATLSIDYYTLGYATGEMAVRILSDGADISEMPIEYPESFTRKYNAEICQQLGIEVSEEYEKLE